MRNILVMIFLACIGCNELTPTPTLCKSDQSEQTGTYTMTTHEESGDCGSMGTLQTEISNGVVHIDDVFGCVPTESSWNDSICETVSTFDCDDGIWEMNLEWTVLSNPDNPSNLTGILKADMSKWGGLYTCSSEYTFEAVKIQN